MAISSAIHPTLAKDYPAPSFPSSPSGYFDAGLRVLPSPLLKFIPYLHQKASGAAKHRRTSSRALDNVEEVGVSNLESVIHRDVEVLVLKKVINATFLALTNFKLKSLNVLVRVSKDEKRSNAQIPVYLKPTSRSKCKAKLRITRQRGGEWTVGRFVMEHNHEMLAVDQRHLLRSSRNISYAQKSILESMVNSGITVSNAVSYMINEAQGPQNLSFIRKDAYDHLGRIKKQTKVENGDASALLHHFINKSNKESNFYWNVQLDDDNRVMNFFLRDSRCEVDYEFFGDILSVDTTYRTNRYNLICAPFVGINQHRQNVLFGLAFMSDETESSFEWLFKTFLDSMNGKQPETIFTDQCQAMMNAIETIFPHSHHRLCQWHINQNAPSHFGSLNGDSSFKRLWNKCMTHCESEEEFESTWSTMIDKYDLSGHK
ncbi:protein FAR1-RELATED SEQUENCE 5-like [Primulina eburnea]|uniref:protein FAR1-RELATED SEQUENCE 5-like n=1 Tax=Primulina eburnea TaxID=1245227 RepID=UPI003C6C4889